MPSLPSFKKLTNRKKERNDVEKSASQTTGDGPGSGSELSKPQLRTATRTRMTWSIICAVCLFLSFIFLVMVEIGNRNKPGLRNIWFIKLDFSNVIPVSVPQASLLNSIARTLGLHDFYQVGLWNYCEGYNDQGVTDCSKPETLYWFDPVSIVLSQLLYGASIQLPSDISDILSIIKLASHWMFGLFLAGTVVSFVLIPSVLLAVQSRWVAFVLMILTLLNGIFVVGGTLIATAMFIIMRIAFAKNKDQININATIGKTMFALMWIASAFAIFAWLIQCSLTCCCRSRRDVRKGKK